MNEDAAVFVVAILIAAAISGGVVLSLNYASTGDPFKFPANIANAPCGEGIHVTHNGQPIADLAIKQPGQGTYTWGSTNQTGYMILGICSSTGAIITFQATDYGFQLEPHQIIEAKI